MKLDKRSKLLLVASPVHAGLINNVNNTKLHVIITIIPLSLLASCLLLVTIAVETVSND